MTRANAVSDAVSPAAAHHGSALKIATLNPLGTALWSSASGGGWSQTWKSVGALSAGIPPHGAIRAVERAPLPRRVAVLQRYDSARRPPMASAAAEIPVGD